MSFKMNTGGGAVGCLLALVVIVLGLLFAMVLGALGIGSANAWFFNADFSAGWHAAWGKPWVLLGWTVLFYGIVAGLVFDRD